MTIITHTYDQVRQLSPCTGGFKTATNLLGGVEAWKTTPASFRKLLEVGVDKDDILWLFSNSPKITERANRHFACDCAERVLPVFEKVYPEDNRPREAIKVARLYADGKATAGELRDAKDAARAAASPAAWAAASSAVRAAASSAAWAAASSAVRDAAWAAARDAASSAAWAAARAAASSAARAAARDAARDAARAAARDAARDAARAAERQWQTNRIIEITENYEAFQ